MHIMVKPRVHSAESTRALASSRRKHVQEAALEAAEEADRIAEHRKKYLERYLRAQGISTSAEDKEARDPIMSIDFLSRLRRATAVLKAPYAKDVSDAPARHEALETSIKQGLLSAPIFRWEAFSLQSRWRQRILSPTTDDARIPTNGTVRILSTTATA